MVYDIDIHELNLRPFRNLKVLDEILLKKCSFCILSNKCIIISSFQEKNHHHIKEEEIFKMGIEFLFFFLFFGMFHEPQI
jgi:hypothetical protein